MTCSIRGFRPAPLLGAAVLVLGSTAAVFRPLWGQGVTTAAMSGVVAAQDGTPLADATIVAAPRPTRTQHRGPPRAGGGDNAPNKRVAGPSRVAGPRLGCKTPAQRRPCPSHWDA